MSNQQNSIATEPVRPTGDMGRATVIIVDDHTVVRRGVRALLEMQEDLWILGEAGSGREAVALCEETAPDVALVDLVLGGDMDGVAVTEAIKTISPRTRVVILTSFLDEAFIVPALRAGAISYLLKDVGGEELLDAVRKAACGEAVLQGRVAALVMQSLSGRPASPVASLSPPPSEDRFAGLSEREKDVLRLLADGLTNQAIADALFISEKTVKSHVSNILSKLHLAHRTEAVALAWREGFVV